MINHTGFPNNLSVMQGKTLRYNAFKNYDQPEALRPPTSGRPSAFRVTHYYLYAILLSILFTGSLSAQNGEISPARKQAIDSLALEKVRDLSKYISIIGNKGTGYSEASRVMDRAEELFAPDSEMGVSLLNRKEVTYYKVRKYFERLMALNYDRVTIQWYDIHYISDLERQPDGRYVGVITIYQRFEGESDDGMRYKDTTKKDITIYVERKKTQIQGRTIEFWDVLLGDIKVSETRA